MGFNCSKMISCKQVVGCKSCPNGYKTSIERSRPILAYNFNDTINKSRVHLGVRWLIHQFGSNHIERGDCCGHEKSGTEGGAKLCGQTFGYYTTTSYHSFDLIIASHFSSIKNHRSHDISLDTSIKPTDSLGSVEFRRSFAHSRRLLALGSHHTSLQNIKWITHNRSKTTRERTGCELQDKV